MAHEITSAFAQAGLPLCESLFDMLNDHSSHCTERRGCGFTQATRFLAAAINRPRNATAANDLSMFANWPVNGTEELALEIVRAGWERGWRGLNAASPTAVARLRKTTLFDQLTNLTPLVRSIRATVVLEESQLFLGLIEDLLTGEGRTATEISGMPEKPVIGSCSQAEEFFLEIAHGRVRRGGKVNVIVDGDGSPVMVEKINLGESHSAILVAPVRINGVWIPPGGLCALRYKDNPSALRQTRHGDVMPIDALDQTRFLRLTTLSVSPVARRRAFRKQVESQLRADMLSPTVTTIGQLHEFAVQQLGMGA